MRRLKLNFFPLISTPETGVRIGTIHVHVLRPVTACFHVNATQKQEDKPLNPARDCLIGSFLLIWFVHPPAPPDDPLPLFSPRSKVYIMEVVKAQPHCIFSVNTQIVQEKLYTFALQKAWHSPSNRNFDSHILWHRSKHYSLLPVPPQGFFSYPCCLRVNFEFRYRRNCKSCTSCKAFKFRPSNDPQKKRSHV